VKSLAEKAVAESWTQTASRSTSNENPLRPRLSFTLIRATTAICIAPTWRGLYRSEPRSRTNNGLETKYCMRAGPVKKRRIQVSQLIRDYALGAKANHSA
jgi:hypothetical protein